MSKGKADALTSKTSRDEARRQEQASLHKAEDAASSGSFWSHVGKVCLTVAKVAAVVASVAVAVVSCGAAAPIAALAIAGAVLSTAGFVQGECHILEKLGVDTKAAGWVGLGMSLGGAACSGGASALATAGAASSQAAATVTTVTKTVKTVTVVTTGAALMGAGAAKIVSTQKEAEADDRSADAMAAHQKVSQLQRALSMMLDDLRAADDGDGRMLDHVKGAIEARGAALSAAAMRV